MDFNGNTPPSRCFDGGLTTTCKPRCFETREQWIEYQRLWQSSYRSVKPMPKVNICRDCTPEHRDKMIDEGRCVHPETVFVIDNDGIIGINGARWGDWMSAISGRWPVVSQPDREYRDAFIEANRFE